MALVDDSDEVVWKIIQQAERTGAGTTSVKIAGIVLYARAVAQLAHHLDVIVHPVFKTFGLQVLANLTEILRLLEHVLLDLLNSGVQLGLGGDEDVRRKDGNLGDLLDTASRDGIEALDGVNLIIPKDNAIGDVGVSRKHI